MSAERINDGGPAFPVAEDHKVAADIPWTCGMSLRDYFATRAMQAALPICGDDSRKEGVSYCEHVASVAYEMADAMLKAREA